jgi:membrane protein
MSTPSPTRLTAWWHRQRDEHPRLTSWLQPVVDVWSELSRVELVDRSLALGAQALLAVIPLLMVLDFSNDGVGTINVDQLEQVTGVSESQLDSLASGLTEATPNTGALSVIVAIASGTSFSRALQRMYARVWHLPTFRGARAVRDSVIWLVVWIVLIQGAAGAIRWAAGIPGASLTIQLIGTTMIWWWTAYLLLGGRVGWRELLPGGLATGALLVLLSRLSHLFMPVFARANLEQFGPLGIVFALASWLVMFGGVLIVATVLGRFVNDLVTRGDAEDTGDRPTRSTRRLIQDG